MPAPMPELPVDDPFVARVQTFVRRGGGDVDIARALEHPSPSVRAFLMRYLATPECADLGAAPWHQTTYDALDAAGRRLLSKTHRAVEAVRSPRSWGLFHAVRALARWPDGRALALVRFAEGSADARYEIARALVDAKEHLTDTELDALATLLDGPATPATLRALTFGVWAAYRRAPSTAFDHLAGHLSPEATRSPDGQQRAIAVLLALRTERDLDPRWGDVIRPLLRDRQLGGFAVWTLDAYPLDASWVDDLLAYLHLDPRLVNVWDRQALALLSRVADARTVDVFLTVMEKNLAAFDAVLAAFERHPDARLRGALEHWAADYDRRGGAADWEPYRHAKALLARVR